MSAPENSPTQTPSRTINVWDLPIRIFHWLLVLSFAGAFITNWLGVRYFKYHAWFGYSIIILVAFRILWGFIGTYHAQFWHFIPSPPKLAQYLKALIRKQAKPYAGHNPLGALMVIALLLGLAVQAITGLYSNDEISNVGPLYSYISNELSLKLTALHQDLAYWILAAVIIHVGAVWVHVKYKREPLVTAMVKGDKPNTATADAPVSIEHS
ncbi:MAG TPA: cytochrome b/b6 domain-containing protein, partial [Marinagarivorans sp.]|nr:cytochrome b/b6 domain-containing protein [Marinagarivorans sp.]